MSSENLPHAVIAQETLDMYKNISTPTLATLLYKKGIGNTFVQGVSKLSKADKPLVGQAFTLRYIPARPDVDGIEVFRDPKHPQRDAVERIPEGFVLVMDCRGDASAASAGSILAKRLEYRGCAGIVTDGGLRDCAGISKLDMQVYCANPSAPTNLTKHHAADINVPVGCGTAPVYPGDLIVGDADGVIVVPLNLVDELAEEALAMESYEKFVIEQVAQGASIIGLYPCTKPENQAKYQSWLTQQQVA